MSDAIPRHALLMMVIHVDVAANTTASHSLTAANTTASHSLTAANTTASHSLTAANTTASSKHYCQPFSDSSKHYCQPFSDSSTLTTSFKSFTTRSMSSFEVVRPMLSRTALEATSGGTPLAKSIGELLQMTKIY